MAQNQPAGVRQKNARFDVVTAQRGTPPSLHLLLKLNDLRSYH
ncbi:hypothetical protein MNBD_ALPHA12-442, partial [hydrothermal vent metagenome]